MKLLTHPSVSVDTITLGGSRTELHTSFNPLGLLGIGPVFKSREVTRHRPSMSFVGRTTLNPIEVDFEDADAKTTCLYYDDSMYCPRKVNKPEGWPLELEARKYIVHGLFPIEKIRGNVWRCSIDHVEEARPVPQ